MGDDSPGGARPTTRITLVAAGDEAAVFKKLKGALDIDSGLVSAKQLVNLGFGKFVTRPEGAKNPISDRVAHAVPEDPSCGRLGVGPKSERGIQMGDSDVSRPVEQSVDGGDPHDLNFRSTKDCTKKSGLSLRKGGVDFRPATLRLLTADHLIDTR
jgi:hypothetical protein